MNLPETRYAKAPDGVSLAYHVVGEGLIDLIWLHAFMGGLEVIWEHEAMRSLTTKLSSFARVIRHDMRATGLSGRATELPNLETQVQDVAAVLDAVGSRSTVILGAGAGSDLLKEAQLGVHIRIVSATVDHLLHPDGPFSGPFPKS